MTEHVPLDEPFLPGLADAVPAGARMAGADEVGAVLRDALAAEPPVPPALVQAIAAEVPGLVAVARALGGDVVLLSARDAEGVGWQGVSAGAYRYISAGGSWSAPRLGDADFSWGERVREALVRLEAAGWLSLAAFGRDHVGLLVRAGGVWLFQGSSSGGAALFHAVRPEGELLLAGIQPHGESRTPVDLFRSLAPIRFVTVEEFASAAARPPVPEADWGEDAADTPADEEGEAPAVNMPQKRPFAAGLLSRLVRVGRRSAPVASA